MIPSDNLIDNWSGQMPSNFAIWTSIKDWKLKDGFITQACLFEKRFNHSLFSSVQFVTI